MAELLSLISSIVQVASFGLSLSRTLHDYGAAVVGAEKRLKGLDKDIDFTSRIISQLGSRLQDHRVQAIVSEDTIRLTQDAVAECDAIFQAMEDVIAKIRGTGSMAKWTIYFRDSKIELLRSNLDRMKGNLNLLMGVIIHGTQMATERPDEVSITAHRAKIRELMVEKEHYTQKYLEEKRKYDQLLEKVNSTSTLGSFILMSATNGAQPITEQAFLAAIETSEARRREADIPGASGPSTQADCNPADATSTLEIKIHSPPEQAGMKPTDPPGTCSGAPIVMETHDSSSLPPAAPARAPQPAGQPAIGAWPIGVTSPSLAAASRNGEEPRKRAKAAKAAKKIARGAGKTVTVALAVAFFPITIPLYLVFFRRHRQQLDDEPDGPVQYQPYQLYQQFQSTSPQQGYTPYPGVPPAHYMGYDSSTIRAELPAMHELPAERPDMALVGRLLNTDGQYNNIR